MSALCVCVRESCLLYVCVFCVRACECVSVLCVGVVVWCRARDVYACEGKRVHPKVGDMITKMVVAGCKAAILGTDIIDLVCN